MRIAEYVLHHNPTSKPQNPKSNIQPMLNLYQLQLFRSRGRRGQLLGGGAAAAHDPAGRQHVGRRAGKGAGGDRLFRRRGQRMELTPFGHQLLGPARQLMTLADQTEQALQAGRGHCRRAAAPGQRHRRGRARPGPPAGTFGRLTPRSASASPPISPAPLLVALRAGDLDVIFLPERVRGRSLDHKLLSTDEWVFVVPPAHPWTSRARRARPGGDRRARRRPSPR